MSDVSTIGGAIFGYAENGGTLPGIPRGKTLKICKMNTPCTGASLDDVLEYIPVDPLQKDDSLDSGYTIHIHKDAGITIAAPMAEGGETISLAL